MRRTVPFRQWRPAVAALGVTLTGCLATAPGQIRPRVFDAPWIGYETAVYPEGISPWTSVTADFNADGRPDLATVSWTGTPWLSILMNDGEAGFLSPATYPIPAESLGVVAGDFDRDNDIDLAVNDTGRFWEGFSFTLFANDGAGNFSRGTSYSTGRTGPTGMTAADFDGDGWLDIAVAHDAYIVSGNTIAIMRNNQSGGFGSPQVISLPSGTRTIASADLDGDLDVDLVVGMESNTFIIMTNNGGAFTRTATYTGMPSGSITELPQVHLADVDRDNDIDVLFSNLFTGGNDNPGIGLWRNNGLGGLDAGTLLPFNKFTNGAAGSDVADVTGDGWPDILAVTESAGDWFLFEGNGQGGFLAARPYRAGQGPITIDGVDLDGDVDADIVIVARDSLEACVYRNPGGGAFVQPVPIDMVSPSIAPCFPTNLVAVDIEGDGDLDLVNGYRSDFSNAFGISVRRNQGDATFEPRETYTDSTYPIQVRAADIDGDLDPDLLYVDSGNRIQRRLNDGNGVFGARTLIRSVSRCEFFNLWDIDNDLDLDIVATGFFESVVLLNDGKGNFGAPISTPLEDFVTVLGMGDFNEDLKLDLLSDTGVQAYPQISLGNGNGTFGRSNTVPTGRGAHAFATADFDGDDNLDFATIYNLDEKGLSIRRGRGDGNFFLNQNYPGTYAAADHTSGVIAADMDGNGSIDVASAVFASQDLAFWSGNGDGTFDRVTRYGVGQDAYDVQIGDFDGDDVPDAAVVCQVDVGFWWYPGVIILKGVGEAANGLRLEQSALRRGQPATLTASNAVPGESIYFLYSLSGVGSGPCPPQLGGLCLDLRLPVEQIGFAAANAEGVAERTVRIPANAPLGAAVATQAVARRGSGGSESAKSNTVESQIQP